MVRRNACELITTDGRRRPFFGTATGTDCCGSGPVGGFSGGLAEDLSLNLPATGPVVWPLTARRARGKPGGNPLYIVAKCLVTGGSSTKSLAPPAPFQISSPANSHQRFG